MSAITITDLRQDHALGRKAMSCLRGAGAPWVFGWMQPFVATTPSFAPAVNFFQINNSFYAEQVIDQSKTVNINNSAPNSTITAVLISSMSNTGLVF